MISDGELLVMRLIDQIYTDEPTWGYRIIAAILRRGYGSAGQQEESAKDCALFLSQ